MFKNIIDCGEIVGKFDLDKINGAFAPFILVFRLVFVDLNIDR
ncbi:hypothetical protein APA_111 [Pseudanabaena sp. lw0831]|nr:hypothetical protein APA_111 [Pseudanabaena sp. lw0831]